MRRGLLVVVVALCLTQHFAAVHAAVQVGGDACEGAKAHAFEVVFHLDDVENHSSFDTFVIPPNTTHVLGEVERECGASLPSVEAVLTSLPPLVAYLFRPFTEGQPHLAALVAVVASGMEERLGEVAQRLVQARRSKAVGEETLVQAQSTSRLRSPIMLFTSPKMWWVRADPIATSTHCTWLHSVAYVSSWLAFGWFLWAARRLIERSPTDRTQKFDHLVVSGIAAVMSGFLYALIVSRCADRTRYSECHVTSRATWNYVWPGLMLMLGNYAKEYSVKPLDPATDAFVFNSKRQQQPIKTWAQGREMALGGRKAGSLSFDESSASHSPPTPPDSSLGQGFYTGVAWVAIAISAWLQACPGQ